MNKDPNEIVAAQNDLSGWDDDLITPFAPSIEDPRKSPGDVFLPDHPLVMLESGNYNRVPWLTGVNSQEGATLYSASMERVIDGIFSSTINLKIYLNHLCNVCLVILNSTELTEEFNGNWNRMAPFALSYKEAVNDGNDEASTNIRNFYFANRPIDLDSRENLTNLFSDRNFFQCNRNAAILHARFSPVYLYYFTQPGPLSWLDIFKIPQEFGYDGVAHSDPVQFFFKLHNFPEITNDSIIAPFSSNLVKLWTSFAEFRLV